MSNTNSRTAAAPYVFRDEISARLNVQKHRRLEIELADFLPPATGRLR